MAPMQMMRCRLVAVAGLPALAGPACHVLVPSESTRATATERVMHVEGAIAHRAALVWTEAGRLRLVEPLECPTEEVVHQRRSIEVATRPDLAAFTVGVIAAAAGGVMLTTGLFASDPAASPYTHLGAASSGVSLPLVIGPRLGDRVEVCEGGGPGVVRRPGPSQPCGERPLAARSASAAAARRGPAIELPVELRDVHGTAPPTPVRFHGVLLGAPPGGS